MTRPHSAPEATIGPRLDQMSVIQMSWITVNLTTVNPPDNAPSFW